MGNHRCQSVHGPGDKYRRKQARACSGPKREMIPRLHGTPVCRPGRTRPGYKILLAGIWLRQRQHRCFCSESLVVWGTSFVHVRFTFFLLYIHTHPLSVSDFQSGKLKRKGKGKRRNTHENIADDWERNTTSLKPRKKAAGYEMVYVWTRGSCRRVAPGTTLVKAQSRANCRARSPPLSVARTRVQFRQPASQPARMETGTRDERDGTKPRGSPTRSLHACALFI